ncbi:oxytocin-neurophysin 1-like [Eriocheir sinensis]|uniref:oxytocin-neurophysin 1-like n=1 Tax=Eriocheir sinensis TaxID=95602 RepID=UPI0021C9F283|nr:oxytocin-neurophysin 1-like [Eriocheir sinensis]XP_050712787.1 oxytocin-neurophysin 1-like [Eriocheir sinensis]
MQAGVAVTVVVTLLVGGAAACFITNCPPGGKRSGGIMSQLGHARTCTSCGPGLLGRCIGPDICCGARVGCFIGSRETRLCRTENMVPIRCSNADLKPCGRMQEGRCAAAGLCCTETKCELDDNCVMEDTRSEELGAGQQLRGGGRPPHFALLPAVSDRWEEQ